MSDPMSARITDQGRAYVAWLDSLGDEEPTRTGAFAAGVEWERGRAEAVSPVMSRLQEQVAFLLSCIRSGEELDVSEYHKAHALIQESKTALSVLIQEPQS